MQPFDNMCRGLEFSVDGVSLRPKIKEMYEKIPSLGEYGCFLELIHTTWRFAPNGQFEAPLHKVTATKCELKKAVRCYAGNSHNNCTTGNKIQLGKIPEPTVHASGKAAVCIYNK